MAMIKVSEPAMDAVMSKAKQSGMEDFAADFMAELRLENREIHTALDGLLNTYMHTIMPGIDVSKFMDLFQDDDKELDMDAVKDVSESMSKFMELAQHGRVMTVCTVGVIYKALKAEIEARELEEE
jgi:hypothetical protein